MKLGYTIIYVPNVAESLSFFESAFGLSRRFLHESGDYGELETGETTLAFASHELGNANFPTGFVAASESSKPLGIEIALVTPFVVEAHAKALAAGATELKEPETKPWGASCLLRPMSRRNFGRSMLAGWWLNCGITLGVRAKVMVDDLARKQSCRTAVFLN